MTSKFSHPHICTLYDIGSQEGIDYLVMEYVEGETLGQRLAKSPLPPAQALIYGARLQRLWTRRTVTELFTAI